VSSEALSLRWRARAMFAAAAIPPLVHAIPLNRLSRWLSRPGRRDDGLNDEHLAGWVDRVLLRAPFLWHYTCLKRGAVLFLLLRRAGRAVRLHIGVRKDEQTLRAHAWLVLDGRPYLEHDDHTVTTYQEIAAFPEHA